LVKIDVRNFELSW